MLLRYYSTTFRCTFTFRILSTSIELLNSSSTLSFSPLLFLLLIAFGYYRDLLFTKMVPSSRHKDDIVRGVKNFRLICYPGNTKGESSNPRSSENFFFPDFQLKTGRIHYHLRKEIVVIITFSTKLYF